MSAPCAPKLRVAVGSDHAAYDLKKSVLQYLSTLPNVSTVVDCGTDSSSSVDYPDYALRVGALLNSTGDDRVDRGLLFCGTGIGISIAANKIKGIRAGLCHNEFTARLCRQHNDANVMCAGARVLGEALVLEMVKVFLEEKFEDNGNHPRRVRKLAAMDKEKEKL